MKKPLKITSILCYILFLLVSFGLPLFSFEGYSIIANTTSHLAAQGAPYAWVMDVVFVCLGISAIRTVWDTRVRYHQVVGRLFGLSLVLTAFFPHAPLVAGIPVNVFQDQMHSIFASVTGFAFTMLAMGHGIMSTGRQRIGGVLLAGIAVCISLGMMAVPAVMGLLQRIMFIASFGWLFFFMEVSPEHQVLGKR